MTHPITPDMGSFCDPAIAAALTRQHLDTLAADWPAARAGTPVDRQAWMDRARQAADVRAALPERFIPVLDDLLNALESSALFTDESCSFSQGDILDGIGVWLKKAQQELSNANA